MSERIARLRENVQRVREQIATAARRGGRSPESVRLVAVTKYVEADVARDLLEVDCCEWGESRPQELWHKAETLADPRIAWHLIGPLQRNKLARTLPLVTWVHSGDRLSVLDAIHAWAMSQDRSVRTLIEVNVSGDATKHGFAPAELDALGPILAERPGIDVRGLMTMASREGDLDRARREFESLAALAERLRSAWPDAVATLPELSMGMSGDFESAIEAGATMVRIGSALFEGVA